MLNDILPAASRRGECHFSLTLHFGGLTVKNERFKMKLKLTLVQRISLNKTLKTNNADKIKLAFPNEKVNNLFIVAHK